MRRAALAVAIVVALPSHARAGVSAADLGLRSVNGRGVVVEASCALREGQLSAPGSAAHYRYSGAVAGSPLPLATTFEQAIDVHVAGARAVKGGGGGFMSPESNALVIVTERGDLYGRQEAGSCQDPVLDVTESAAGPTVSGQGSWAVTGGTRSFVGASGGGRFTFSAVLGPAVDNALRMDLQGQIGVRSPDVRVSLERVLWADPLDYPFRQPTAIYLVTNTGAGDAYNVRVKPGPNTPASVETLGDPPVADIGRLAAGEGVPVAVRYRMDALECPVPALGCSFVARTILERSDALDLFVPDQTDEWVINVPVVPV